MNPLVAGVGGALAAAGVLAIAVGLRGRPPKSPGRPPRGPLAGRRISRRTLLLAAAGLAIGVVIAVVTGWVVALVIAPAAVAGLPVLLGRSPRGTSIEQLTAMEEWTRSLAGILTAGAGLEQAITATSRSTPEPLRPAVTRLVARLRARWTTEDAIRGFADDLDDPTGDIIALNLLLGAQRRGAGLAAILESLAESVALDVRARRQIEADQAKPRTTARWVTLITIVVLGGLFLTGEYVAPYGTPWGQVLLLLLLGLYVAVLLWMKRMAQGRPVPRVLNAVQPTYAIFSTKTGETPP